MNNLGSQHNVLDNDDRDLLGSMRESIFQQPHKQPSWTSSGLPNIQNRKKSVLFSTFQHISTTTFFLSVCHSSTNVLDEDFVCYPHPSFHIGEVNES